MRATGEKKIALEDDIQVQKLIWKTLLPNFTAELSLSATSIGVAHGAAAPLAGPRRRVLYNWFPTA